VFIVNALIGDHKYDALKIELENKFDDLNAMFSLTEDKLYITWRKDNTGSYEESNSMLAIINVSSSPSTEKILNLPHSNNRAFLQI
jgi:hypothetical protein